MKDRRHNCSATGRVLLDSLRLLRRHLFGDDLEDVDGNSVDHGREKVFLPVVLRG